MVRNLEGIIRMKDNAGRKTVMFGIFKKDISLLLNYFVALEMDRISCIAIKHNRNSVEFTVKDKMYFHVNADGTELSGVFGDYNRDMIKCCCIDNYLYSSYDHVDMDHELCDFVFKIYL